jgi:MoxR-like ATPase
MDEIRGFAEAVRANVERVIVGKRETIDTLLVALLCEGHVLLEDVPGVGKTIAYHSLDRQRIASYSALQ